MAYNYLELVNSVNRKLNETELTSGNFATSSGYYADAKESVNRALTKIYIQDWNWPFTMTEATLTMVVNQSRYDYPADAMKVRYKSFRAVGDGTLLDKTTYLNPLDYEEYLQKFSDMEEQPDRYSGVPTSVIRPPSLEILVAPAPDKAYTVRYEYYTVPDELEAWDDVPAVPKAFKSVIFDGAMHYMYSFKGDLESAQLSYGMFDKGLQDMRQIYSNRTEYVRSTVIRR